MFDPAIEVRWDSAVSGREEQVERAAAGFARLVKLMADLRGTGGCPWDREQSLASLRQYVREEAEEVCSAIDRLLEFEDGLRHKAGMPAADPSPPGKGDSARTGKKGLSIAHHPHRADFDAAASASGAPLPALSVEDRRERDKLYGELIAELGDLMLQPVFQGDILLALGYPGADESIEQLLDKLIRRHPHVYGGKKVSNAAEVLANWEEIKRAERADGD